MRRMLTALVVATMCTSVYLSAVQEEAEEGKTVKAEVVSQSTEEIVNPAEEGEETVLVERVSQKEENTEKVEEEGSSQKPDECTDEEEEV